MNAIPFMSLSAYDIIVSRDQRLTYTRLTPLERTALRVTEIEYRLKQAASPLTSSGAVALQWMRREPILRTVTITVREDSCE